MKICPICRKEYDRGDTCPKCGVTLMNKESKQVKTQEDSYYKVTETQEDNYYKQIPSQNQKEYHKDTEEQHSHYQREEGSIASRDTISIPKNALLGGVLVILCVALIIGAVKYFRGKNDKSSAGTTQVTQSDDLLNDAEATSDTTEETTRSDTDNTENSDDNTDGSDEPYTDNVDMNISDCLTINDYYERTSADGSFHFAYPKYVFNGSNIDEESNYYDYYYEDENGNTLMEMIFYTEDNRGDIVENAKELFKNISDIPNEILYKVEPKDEIKDDGMARGIVAGTYGYGDEDTCVYIVGANDGEKNYIMELYYPDSAPEYDYDDVNYIIDCVYRYCSFAGGTYKPRTWEMFSNDQMGEKKTSSTDTTLISSADKYTDNKKKAFYGIWTKASKNFSEVEKYKETLVIRGFDCSIFLTSQWDNLNKEDWYAISVGVYSTKEEAEKYLPDVQKEYRDAYIKYSGGFCG